VKNLKLPIILVLVLLAVLIVVPTAQASSTPDFPKDRHVLEAVALIYAPMPDNRSGWLDAVCHRMTEGGCGYFTDNIESMLWQKGQDVALNSVVPGKVVTTLEDGSQVWIAAETFRSAFSDVNWEETGIVPDVQAFAEWNTFYFDTDPSIAAAVKLLGHQ
jgi:hypothetical protein